MSENNKTPKAEFESVAEAPASAANLTRLLQSPCDHVTTTPVRADPSDKPRTYPTSPSKTEYTPQQVASNAVKAVTPDTKDGETHKHSGDSFLLEDGTEFSTCVVTKVATNPDSGKKTVSKSIEICYDPTTEAFAKRECGETLDSHGFKPTKATKETNLLRLMNALQYTASNIQDNPMDNIDIARQIYDSDVQFLNLHEVEEDDLEPVYEMWGENATISKSIVDICGDHRLNDDCDDCDLSACHEFLFGDYCVAAVRRYFNENSYIATIKDAYVTFVVHYNRAIDYTGFVEADHHKIRPTTVSKVPSCMRMGSLRFACQWVKWQIENGPYKDWYAQQRKNRKFSKKRKVAKEQMAKQYQKYSKK